MFRISPAATLHMGDAEHYFQKRHETRIIAAFRWLIASTALTIIYLDPTQPDNENWWLTYALLGLYALYGTVVYFLAIRLSPRLKVVEPWEHWIDIGWFTILVSLCTGTNRIFFFGFIFAILVASFRRGFAAGLSVVTVSTFSYTLIGYATETSDPGFSGYGFDVYRFMLRPVFLLVLGYMIANWGGYEIMLKRRLALLKDVTLSNPRFGVDRTIYSLLGQLREYYDADDGLLVTQDAHARGDILYRIAREVETTVAPPETVPAELTALLRAFPPSVAACYSTRGRLRRSPSFYAYDVANGERMDEGHGAAEAMAAALDAVSFITVPIMRHKSAVGRVYFSRKRGRALDISGLFFLSQVIRQANPVIENVKLVDRLASDAAEQERQRIARDIHDSVIQPYIGFQIGLSGVRRKLAAGHADVRAEIERLAEMADVGIVDLRGYVRGLKDTRASSDNFRSMIERFTGKFSEATGISVEVVAPKEIFINDGLAAEVFQMIAEGLSNIRRHTESANAVVRIECEDGRMCLCVENDCAEDGSRAAFTPRSITERAISLGGEAVTCSNANGGTVVRVEIPL